MYITYLNSEISNILPTQKSKKLGRATYKKRVGKKRQAWLKKETELGIKVEKEGEALSNTGA